MGLYTFNLRHPPIREDSSDFSPFHSLILLQDVCEGIAIVGNDGDKALKFVKLLALFIINIDGIICSGSVSELSASFRLCPSVSYLPVFYLKLQFYMMGNTSS